MKSLTHLISSLILRTKMTEDMKALTWGQALKMACTDFCLEESDALLLLEYAGKLGRSRIRLLWNDTMPADALTRYHEVLDKRLTHLPVQYITGESCFCGLDFKVNRNVLIPRPETELLAEAVFTSCTGKSVLDMCTGSGCIAVTVAKLGKPALVTASDVSEKALEVARENAAKNEAEVRFVQGDLFESVIGERFDIIVSNPPYIASAEVDTLMPDVKDFEPRLALDGMEDGLYFYRKIAKEAAEHLNPQGRLMLEIGNDQGESVPALLEENGFTDITVKKDYSGLDRMVFATKE